MARIQRSQAARKSAASTRQKADIVFVVDRSYSMSGCLEGVKNHIINFVQGLEANQQVRIDWRLGLVAADSDKYSVLEFTDNPRTFQNAVSKIALTGNECMLPALDVAADLPWRDNVHKAILFFTDEPVAGGSNYNEQKDGIEALGEKLERLKIELYAFTPTCPDYLALTDNLPRSKHRLDQDFNSYDYADVLMTIGKSVSRSASQGAQNISAVNRVGAVYDLNNLGITVEQL